jgi:hypothetical protein
LDRHPRISDAAAPAPRIAIDEKGHLSMTVTKRPHVKLEVEASTDLLTWLLAMVVTEDETSFTAREDFSVDSPGGRFLRLRATAE